MNIPNHDELKAEALRLEGESMLASIVPQSDKKPLLVGADGNSLGKPEEASKVELSPEANRQQAEYALEQRRLESAHKLEVIMAKNPNAAKARDIAYLAYQMVFWATMELSRDDNITDEMIDDMKYMLQWSLLRKAKEFDFKQMVSKLKNAVVPALKDFEHEYAAGGRVLGMRMKYISKILGDKGIPTTKGIEALLGKPLLPRNMLVLRGDPASTKAALDFLRNQMPEKIGVFTCAVNNPDGKSRKNTFPESWWTNAAVSSEKLYETLQPIVKAEALLLCVEDVNLLLTEEKPVLAEREKPAVESKSDEKIEERKFSPEERKAFAIKRLYEWGSTNMVAIIACDPITDAVRVQRPYGVIPYVPVSLTGTALSIGIDTFKIGE